MPRRVVTSTNAKVTIAEAYREETVGDELRRWERDRGAVVPEPSDEEYAFERALDSALRAPLTPEEVADLQDLASLPTPELLAYVELTGLDPSDEERKALLIRVAVALAALPADATDADKLEVLEPLH